MTTPAITWKVTITTGSNDAIDFKEEGGGELNATLDAGSYDPFGADTLAGSLAKEIKTQLDATGDTYSVAISSAGIMSVTVTGAKSDVELLFSTGTNAATSARYVMGYGAVDTGSAATVTAASQVYGVFLFGSGGPDLSNDTEDRPSINSPQHEAMDGGVVERPLGDVRYSRKIGISFIPRVKMFKSDNCAKSIEDLFEYVRGGNTRRIKYYSDPSAQTASDYTEYHVTPESGSTSSLENWQRQSAGVELWSGDMLLKKYVS